MHSAPSRSGPLRIVLLGLPRAGKTGLVAALGQLRQEQPALLKGELADAGGGLEQRRQQFYDASPESTVETAVPYPVRFRPAGRRARTLDAVLIDGSGQALLDLVKQRRANAVDTGIASLLSAIRDADALVVAVDAAMKLETADKVWTEMGRLLRDLERDRGQQLDVTGLPVFVVLTRCDRLAHDTDGNLEWVERIEARKRQADQRLNEALEEGPESRPEAFGRLDVRLWATAMKRPPLAGNPAKLREPYGVAEFFRQCLDEAYCFRLRGRRADRRLWWAVRGMSLIVFAMLAFSVVMATGLLTRPRTDLQNRVERYRLKEGSTIAARLHDWPPDLVLRRAELEEIRKDSEFDLLPGHLRDFVDERRRELDEYLPYLNDVLSARVSVIVHNDEELGKRQKQLDERLRLPHDEWHETGAGKLRKQRLDDLKLLRERADQAEKAYRQMRADGLKLWLSNGREGELDWSPWQVDVEAFLGAADESAPDVRKALSDLPPHSLLTPSAILNFDPVRKARQAALATYDDVASLRDLSFALRLGHDDPLRPDLLRLPPQVSAEEAARRWDWLRHHWPPPPLLPALAGLAAPSGSGLRVVAAFPPGHRWMSTYPKSETAFSAERISDAVRPVIEQRVKTSRGYLLRSAHTLVLGKFRQIAGDAADTPDHWKQVARWLASDPPELRPYRGLAGVLGRLFLSPPPNPVEELATFLQKDEFPLSVSGASVTIPDRTLSGLRFPDLPERTQFVVKHGDRMISFTQDVEHNSRDEKAQATTYVFKGPTQQIVYKPGDASTFSLDLPDGRMLTWQEKRTRTFGFEAASLPPRVHTTNPPQQPEAGTPAAGVSLTLETDKPLPAVPELLPDVRNKANR